MRLRNGFKIVREEYYLGLIVVSQLQDNEWNSGTGSEFRTLQALADIAASPLGAWVHATDLL